MWVCFLFLWWGWWKCRSGSHTCSLGHEEHNKPLRRLASLTPLLCFFPLLTDLLSPRFTRLLMWPTALISLVSFVFLLVSPPESSHSSSNNKLQRCQIHETSLKFDEALVEATLMGLVKCYEEDLVNSWHRLISGKREVLNQIIKTSGTKKTGKTKTSNFSSWESLTWSHIHSRDALIQFQRHIPRFIFEHMWYHITWTNMLHSN